MRPAIVACLVLALVACSKSSDTEKVVKEARSWTATLELASRGLAHHDLPPRYARQVAEVAEKAVSKDIEKADDSESRDACTQALESARRLREAAQAR
ncbi:MAG TPA: hypothetical protein VH087_11485 [Thermoanaerobaculia bacterium]|jgi:hypothetical protein|nr:hypothetical protein [Thermoanaerobaculia bacterium]